MNVSTTGSFGFSPFLGPKLCPSLFIWAICLACSVLALGQKNIVLRGRVVNEVGEPINAAKVCIVMPPCEKCLDQLVPCMTTEPEGLFYFHIEARSDAAKGMIFVEEKPPPGFRLVYDPSILLDQKPEFSGTAFRMPPKDSLIDVGDVRRRVTYVSFSVDFSRHFPDELMTDAHVQQLAFQVADTQRVPITKFQVIPKKFWETPSSVRLYLPEGKWILNIVLKRGEDRLKKSLQIEAYKTGDKVRIIELSGQDQF